MNRLFSMLSPLSSSSLELLRLTTMRSLLGVDARQDPGINELLRIAAHSLRCPMALISLVDGDAQWPRASYGLPDLDIAMETALCAETMKQVDVRVVTDTTLDPVMSRHPMVTGEPGIRFYAGIALRIDGHRIGALSLLDREPRTLDSQARTLLIEIAHAVETCLSVRRHEAALAEREREFRLLAEQMPGVVYRMPLDGDLVPDYVSPQVQSFGYTPEQWMQSPSAWFAAIHPDDIDDVLEAQSLAPARGGAFELRYRLKTASGRWLHVRDVVRVVHPPDGSVPVLHGVILDLSRQIAMRDRHEAIVQGLPEGVLVLDEQGVIIEANPRLQDMLAASPAHLLGRHLSDVFAQDAGHTTPIGESVRWRYVHPDGRTRHLEAAVGSLTRGLQVLVVRDVSLQQREDGWLRKLSQAADQASESIVITDLQANIEYVNQASLRSSGYTREELIGRNSRILQSGLTPLSRYKKLWSTLLAGKVWRGFFNNQRKDGSHYIEFAVISPVFGPDGRVTNYLAVKEDITEKRRMGEDLQRYRHHLDELVAQRTSELEKARRSAEAANAAKSAFLATMSHEIRTPMNGVVGIADVLQRSDLTPHQRDLVDTMRESALALLSVIDDILDFSKIEAGKLTLEQAPVSLQRMVEKASDALQPVAAAREVSLHAFVDPDLPEMIVGDAARLRQIVINLVGNAIKFSAGLNRRGGVALRLLTDGPGRMCLQVEDNGIGMSQDVLQRVFQPFVQGEASTTRHYGGTGLGLVITQRLVDAMNGAIEVRSEPDQGSVFSVHLPLTASGDGALVASSSPVRLDGLRVWVVTDEDRRAQDWGRYLRAAGAWVGFSRPGQTSRPEPGSVVVCAAEDMDRWPSEAVAQVHAVLVRSELRSPPRLVCAGLVELNGLGLHRDELLRAVALAAGTLAEPASAGQVSTPPPGPRVSTQPHPDAQPEAPEPCILVVEDSEINQVVIRQQLELLGLASEHVNDGKEALARWQADRGRYSLILSDLHMPHLDGFALAEAIRADEASRAGGRVPMIALTANVAGADAERCRRAGMDDFLSKPVQLERLRDTLQQWLRRPVAAPVPLAGRSAVMQDTLREIARPDFDDSVLQRLVGTDVEAMADIRQRYLKSLDTAVSDIAAQVQCGDWKAAGLTAHRLKSSSRALGALRLGWIFELMETAGRQGDGTRMLELATDLVTAAAAAARHYRPSRLHGWSVLKPAILCVDDDPSQLAWLERELRAMGVARPETFSTGEKLLSRLGDTGTEAVLLLVDMNMPAMDGIDLIRKLVKLRFAGMLLLLGGADRRLTEAAERLARAHGLRTLGHLLKPLREESLRTTLARWPLMSQIRQGDATLPG